MANERRQLRWAGLSCTLWGTLCALFWGEGAALMAGMALAFAALFFLAAVHLRLSRPDETCRGRGGRAAMQALQGTRGATASGNE